MKEKLLFIIVIIIGLALLLGSLTWLNVQIVQRTDAGEFFLVPWTSARAFLFEGENPYLPSVAQRVQVSIYGQYAQEGDYSYHLEIPFYKLFLYFPFALISNFELALALWMSFAQLALLGVGFLSVDLTGWKPSTLNAILFYSTLLFSFYGFYPILGGSGAVFSALIFLLMLFAAREGQDEILGILLVLGTVFPEKGGVLFFLLIFWILATRRFRAISVAMMSLITLVALSFLLLPGWFMPYFEMLSASFRVRYGFLFSDLLQLWMPTAGYLVSQILRWIIIITILVEWFVMRKSTFQHFLWTAAFSIVAMPFLNIRVSPYFFTILLFPLPLVLKMAYDRWGQFSNWFASFFFLLMLGAWLFFGQTENTIQLLTFSYPALLFLGLMWMRWWHLRLPHTWFDEIEKYQQK